MTSFPPEANYDAEQERWLQTRFEMLSRKTLLFYVLQQNSVPPRPWHSIALDWINRLPESRNHNTRLLVIVYRLTKRVRLIPTKHADTATDFARVFLTDFVRPHSIHSDREKTLLSEFWQSYCLLTGIKHKPTTAFHRLVERANQTVKQLLHVIQPQTAWEDKLPLVEIAYNNATNSAGYSPSLGYHPTFTMMHMIRQWLQG
jgi:hypothetical protein